MTNKGKLKKGATLVELSVVLAVLSIISTMVVSFSIFLSERTKTTVKANDLMQDIVSTKTITKSWVENLTTLDAEGSLLDAEFFCDNNILSARIGQNEYYSITLNNKSLSATMPNGQTLSVKLNVITEIEFNMQTNSSETIYICKAFYQADNGVEYFAFAINPFVGDIV